MRLATITNWAYGITVGLTLASGATMLLASNMQEREREAVAQRYALDKAASQVGEDVYALTDNARQFFNTGDPAYLVVYKRTLAELGSAEARVRRLGDAGATTDELDAVKSAMRWADTLQDEQAAALAAHDRGDEAAGRQILFGNEYQRELDRVETLITRFKDKLDQRTGEEVRAASRLAGLWKTVSEVTLGLTALLFLCVLYFVFKRRVLQPVVKLSDVVGRLAAQDFAVEPPDIDQIDEIGDMAQALRVFRENGIARQQLEAERSADRSLRDLLGRMTQRMQGCDSLEDLKDVIVRFVPEIAPAYAGRLYLLDARRNAVAEACQWLDPVYSRHDFSPTSCWALRRGLPHRPAARTIDVPCEHIELHGAPLPDTLCLPLIAQREVLGLIYFEPRAGSEQWQEVPQIYLTMLAENVSLALANLQLRDALREQAMADPLTGLANRRRLEAVLEETLDAAHRSEQPVSCLMIDVDRFKSFNDSFGHDAGDAVLRQVGAVLRNSVREPGYAFRYGGEEFTILLPGVEAAQAGFRAEEIRQRIAALRLSHGGQDLGPISVSIGVACAPTECRYSRLVQAADAALLEAKAAGRDRVQIAKRAA